jgi:TPR repeat protein
MVSLGLLKQSGNGVPKDPAAAVKLYQQAFDLHFPEGGVQLGYAYATGTGTKKDVLRAVDVYKQASLDGSALATFNLGVLYLERGLALGSASEALELFLRAADQGEPAGYVLAARILDRVDRDYETAAQYLLMGNATDAGDAFDELINKADTWSADTIRAVQRKLRDANYYQGKVDGQSGLKLAAALNQWRLLGPP